MMKLALVILSVALLPVLSVAQTMQLSSGSLQVLNGTTLTIEGPIEWVISPGSTVVNDGVIDLGTQAQLNEPVGGPVVGTGVERATHVGPGPFAGIEPGGLGAMLSTEDALNDLVVERGHAPYAHSGSVEGVARWYRIESTTMNGALELTFHYDPTELNGSNAATLGLFRSADGTAPWTGTLTVPGPGPNELTTSIAYPWPVVTAFDTDLITMVGEPERTEGFLLWPTLATDILNVRTTGTKPIATAEVLDAIGRTKWTPQMSASSFVYTLDITHLTSGQYFLRINGERVLPFLKP